MSGDKIPELPLAQLGAELEKYMDTVTDAIMDVKNGPSVFGTLGFDDEGPYISFIDEETELILRHGPKLPPGYDIVNKVRPGIGDVLAVLPEGQDMSKWTNPPKVYRIV